MITRISSVTLLILCIHFVHVDSVEAEDVTALRAAVVKITSKEQGKTSTGTGFIVYLENEEALILTAAHVVGADPQPKVEFFTNPNVPVPATVLNKEGEETTSLALLMVQGKDNYASGLKAVSFSPASQLSGGEAVIAIGFPAGAGPWTLLKGTIASRKGRNLVVDINIDAGSSGGPLIQHGYVIGLMAEATRYGFAVPSDSLTDYLAKAIPGPELERWLANDGVIPAGEFLMSSPDGEGENHEHPAHKVRFSKPVAIARYETTFEEYDRFAQATGRPLPDDAGFGRGRRPVISVSWEDARDYAAWMSQQTGKQYRLPTEAEWEYAARSGGTNETWAGTSHEKQIADFAVYEGNSQKRTAPVGSKKPNGFGLHDMSGNVSEWVADCWHFSYQGAPKDGTAWGETGSGDCGRRVVRGGSWYDFPVDLRVSYRLRYDAGFRGVIIGFRLAQDID